MLKNKKIKNKVSKTKMSEKKMMKDKMSKKKMSRDGLPSRRNIKGKISKKYFGNKSDKKLNIKWRI